MARIPACKRRCLVISVVPVLLGICCPPVEAFQAPPRHSRTKFGDAHKSSFQTFPTAINTAFLPLHLEATTSLRGQFLCRCPSTRSTSNGRVFARCRTHRNCDVTRCNAMKFPLVSATDTWGNVAMLCFSATLAQRLGTTTAVGKLLGPPVTAMALSFVLASIGVSNAGGTVASRQIQWLSLSFATPLMLLGADLQNCVSRCGPLLWSFLAASLATTIGCVVGWQVAGPMLVSALGKKDGLVIAAALMAKNIGGGINYIAVCRCLSASPQAVAAGLVVDNLFALVYFPATSVLSAGSPDVLDEEPKNVSESTSSLAGKQKQINEATVTTTTSRTTATSSTSKSVFQICNLLFLSSTFLCFGERVGGVAGALPCCTIMTLFFAWIVAPQKWMQDLQKPAEILGTSCLYLFFASAGAPGIAIADSVKMALLPLSLFLSCLYGFHFFILWAMNRIGGGQWSWWRWWRMGSATSKRNVPPFLHKNRLLVASSAAIGGPATAVALAQANHWRNLLVPSLLVGNIGYAIATFCGLGFAKFFGSL